MKFILLSLMLMACGSKHTDEQAPAAEVQVPVMHQRSGIVYMGKPLDYSEVENIQLVIEPNDASYIVSASYQGHTMDRDELDALNADRAFVLQQVKVSQ